MHLTAASAYYKTKKIDGVRKYEVKWMYDVVFHETNDNAETANENVNFQTVEFTGEILPIIGLGNDDWCEEQLRHRTGCYHSTSHLCQTSPALRH